MAEYYGKKEIIQLIRDRIKYPEIEKRQDSKTEEQTVNDDKPNETQLLPPQKPIINPKFPLHYIAKQWLVRNINFFVDRIRMGKAEAYNNYGVGLTEDLKKYNDSIPYFKKAIELKSNYADPWNNLSVAYAALNKHDEAIDAIQQSLDINLFYPTGYNNLSSFLIIKKDYEGAIKNANKALALRPGYGKAWLNKGRALIEQGKEQEALECFKNACMEADLNTDFGFSSYAQVAMKVKAYDEAIKAYQYLKQINPDFQDVDFNLANAYFLNDQCDKAISMYKRLLEGNPSDFRIRYNLGEAYLKKSDYKQALDCYNQVQQYAHMLPRVGLRIAECYDKLGNQEKSKKMLVKVAENNRLPQDVKKIAQNQLDQFAQIATVTA